MFSTYILKVVALKLTSPISPPWNFVYLCFACVLVKKKKKEFKTCARLQQENMCGAGPAASRPADGFEPADLCIITPAV